MNAIHADIAAADKALELPENKLFESHKFFSQNDATSNGIINGT